MSSAFNSFLSGRVRNRELSNEDFPCSVEVLCVRRLRTFDFEATDDIEFPTSLISITSMLGCLPVALRLEKIFAFLSLRKGHRNGLETM